MAFVVVYDASVLHPAPLRDLLLRLAGKRALHLRPRWTAAILDEVVDSILRRRPELKPDQLWRTVALMGRAVPDALVTGWEPLVDALALPDDDDRHVLAAAIRAGAEVIVTANLRDFPADRLAPWGVDARHPDAFVVDLLDLHEPSVVAAVVEQAAALRNPPRTASDVVEALRPCGLSLAADRLAAAVA